MKQHGLVFHPRFESTAFKRKWHLQYSHSHPLLLFACFYYHSPFLLSSQASCTNNKRLYTRVPHVCIFGSGPHPPLVDKTRDPMRILPTRRKERERDQKSPWRWLRKWNRFLASYNWVPLWPGPLFENNQRLFRHLARPGC